MYFFIYLKGEFHENILFGKFITYFDKTFCENLYYKFSNVTQHNSNGINYSNIGDIV